MKVEILTLCDYATAEPNGKLNILGAFDRFWSHTVPMKWPICCLASKLRFEKGEEGPKRITLAFIDADGKPVLPVLNIPVNVRAYPNESYASLALAMPIQLLHLPRFGEYAIGLSVDGRQEASIPLFVHEAPKIPPFPPQSPA
jgi:hypothetical protein